MFRGMLSTSLALMLAVPVFAGEVPNFDISRHCRRLASDSYSLELACQQSEEQDRNWLYGTDYGPDLLAHCTRIAGDSYGLLKACIEMEGSAKATLGGGRSFVPSGVRSIAPMVEHRPGCNVDNTICQK